MRPIHALIVAIPIGLALGIGGFTFFYAKGGSYLTNDPAACANCHVMQDYYAAWQRSSHHAVAVCNDCHTPKDLVGKYGTKAMNGWHHSLAFTTGDFHEPIQITERNRAIAEHSCRKCHAELTQGIENPLAVAAHGGGGAVEELSCIRCHGAVGHPMR
jgi:cytochrome c nitrite reductase small subunit